MIKDFDALRITVASPEQILSWSHGEVRKPETINYRTHRAEVDGLMDEKIFGPTKNYECYCGKYKKIRYKGIVCDQCGVEVTHKRVRRERMGHIKLASPVTHVWFAYGIPNKLSLILDIPQKKLETVIYFARYIVTDYSENGKETAMESVKDRLDIAIEDLKQELKDALDEQKEDYKKQKEELKKTEKEKSKLSMALQTLENKEKKEEARLKSIYSQKEDKLKERFKNISETVSNLQEGTTLSDEERTELSDFGIDFFEVGMGADAIRKLLKKINLDTEIDNLAEEVKKTRSKTKQRKIVQRLRIFKGMRNAGTEPSWMVLDIVPILPPDLRPIIQLPGGRFATSDLNDLYRRVINRNNRLQRLIKLGAPEIILRNERRMLQEAVDALIDNSHRPGNPVLNSRDQAYKSLSDMLRGKQGRFRQNLLGKRVDYSARSVIVAGPNLDIYSCGLPKTMALELFKPFVLSEILREGHAPNIKSAKLFYESQTSEVWDILEKVTKNHPVLLNRAPTLHKQGIQAFYPILVEGNAIRLHPMVCRGFNADFDGDQMAVHVPLTKRAIDEALSRMMPEQNLLLMADGSPVINPEKDMALGIFYLTGEDKIESKDIRYFGSFIEAEGAYELEIIKLREKIRVLKDGEILETTVGRIFFNEITPEGYEYINRQLNKKDIAKISATLLEKFDSKIAINFLDKVKALGFKFATLSGISISYSDFVISAEKDVILEEVTKKEEQYTQDFYMGLLTNDERKRLVEEAWMDAIDKIAVITWKKYLEKENNLVTLNDSGATPVENPLRQISGVKGLILDPMGRIVELPLRSNYKEGLSSLEYFVAARGTRKGLADTALKTAESGYLTRRLVDIAQDVIIRSEDCFTNKGVEEMRDTKRRIDFETRIKGRFLAEDVVDPKTGEIIVKANELVTRDIASIINSNENIQKVIVRSPMTCKTIRGVCQKCYGNSLGTGKLVEVGIAVGIIAAQAMGEAATQLTLNTKHLAGRAGTDITQGLPRVEELFEARTPKAKALLSPIDGKVKINVDEKAATKTIIISSTEEKTKKIKIEEGDKLNFKRNKRFKKGEVLLTKKDGSELEVPESGSAKVEEDYIVFSIQNELEEIFQLHIDTPVIVSDGDEVQKGAILTPGSLDPKEILEINDPEATKRYIIDNIQETYGIQGIALDDRHVEIVVRQMMRFGKITDFGDSEYLPGDYVDFLEIEQANEALEKEGKKLIKYEIQLLGLTTASIKTESFLSAASFQEQVRVLTDAAMVGKIDDLRGLKENVIIGRPVPLGEVLRNKMALAKSIADAKLVEVVEVTEEVLADPGIVIDEEIENVMQAE
ncbi:DNA-directed RNA polymerase subunit beta' [Candidatus Dojkabacteria bacterium]|nr:DNA-directed RNA polymerase subunit beta' [Candidatus Dojkabacteria bacterium]